MFNNNCSDNNLTMFYICGNECTSHFLEEIWGNKEDIMQFVLTLVEVIISQINHGNLGTDKWKIIYPVFRSLSIK